MNDADVVFLSAVRTAQGRFQGGFSTVSAVDLGALAIKEAVMRAGVLPEHVSEVLYGSAIQAGLGMNIARQASLSAGLPEGCPAMTLNRLCGSSVSAVSVGALMIRAGEARIIVAGGVENMTQAPWLLKNCRSGYRMGMPTDEVYDALVLDGLWCPSGDYHVGMTAEILSHRFGVSRQAQDEFAYESQVRAVAAIAEGRFVDEIVPVVISERTGGTTALKVDECPRSDVSREGLAELPPIFKPDGGVVTVGNSSAISDGASAVVICSRATAKEFALTPIAQLVSYSTAGVDPSVMGYGEVVAAKKSLDAVGLAARDVDLAELNEAFACVAVLATRELGLSREKVNVNGGAVALGHPLSSTGTRMMATLIHELQRRGQETGLVAACVGGGQGVAAVIRLES